jgi:hypothetical protein
MALALYDRVKETTTVAGTGTATLLGATTGFQSFAVVGDANTTYYCIADQGGANWEVGIGTYTASGTTLARTTVLSSSNADALVVFTAGIKDVFVTYPSSKGLWKDASGNAIGLGTPAAFVGTNITGTASGLTAGNVTTNANLTGAVTSSGNATSLGSFTSLQLATALTNETGTGSAVFSDNASLLNPTYTGTLTGSTGVLNIGSGQVYKDASGNVGIGTSSPGAKLDINTTASGNILNVQGASGPSAEINISLTSGTSNAEAILNFGSNLATSARYAGRIAYSTNNNYMVFWTNTAERMRIDSSGNVGIGTSSPTQKLTAWVAGTLPSVIPNCQMLIGDTSTFANTGLALVTAVGNQSRVSFGSTASPLLGSINYDNTSNYMYFTTNSTEAMRIDSSGNVGIGTSSPATYGKLVVKQTADTSISSLALVAQASTTDSQLGIGYDSASGTFRLTSSYLSTGVFKPISFWTSDVERMRIDSSGNVGIGTSSPSGKLHVQNSTNPILVEPAGTWAAKIYQAQDSPALNGLVVGNRYATNTSTVFEAGSLYGGGSGSWKSFYKIDGIGAHVWGNNTSEAMRLDASGNLLVGTTAALYSNQGGVQLSNSAIGAIVVGHTTGTSSGNGYINFNYNASAIGSITQNGTTGVLYNLTSDYRLKNNPTALTGASEFIKALQPKTWDWWDGSGKGVGFIAHEFMDVAKYSGTGTKDEVDAEGKPVMQAIQPSSSEVMANLVSFVQELKAIIDTQQEQINSLLGK